MIFIAKSVLVKQTFQKLYPVGSNRVKYKKIGYVIFFSWTNYKQILLLRLTQKVFS